MSEEVEEGAPLSVWIGLSLIAVLSFYFQAALTEERFVPALNVIATKFNISDDVAGATLMAAGASSPELFSSIVALFVTHSALGLGTIVGSEIFNQLIICAGAIFASKNGVLELDRAIVTREVFFYGLSIGLLLFALHDIEPVEGDDEDHIFISFFDACVLFGAYVVYVLVCANFGAVVRLFTAITGQGKGDTTKLSNFGHLDDIPFLQAGIHGPAANFNNELYMTKGGEKRVEEIPSGEAQTLLATESAANLTRGFLSGRKQHSQRNAVETTNQYTFGKFSEGNSLRMFQFLVEDEKPSDQHELHDMEINAFQEHLSCFLWQRSYFYSKSKFATKGWNLRWFSLTTAQVSSVPDRADSSRHRIVYPYFNEIEIDEARHIVRIINPDPSKRSYYLMAPCEEILQAVVVKLEAIIKATEGQAGEPETNDSKLLDGAEATDRDPDSHGCLLDFPHGGSSLEIIFHILLFPLKALMHYTIPDVRVLDSKGMPTTTLTKASMASFMCLLWLIVGSYSMVASLEGLADLMNIPDAVIGVTVSAAGTSLPNYIASKIAAEQGFGDMAVSNAFGSNTFNILVALGLPWLLYTSFGTNFQPYHDLRNEGIMESVLILTAVLGIFVVNLLMSGFKLYRWHGYLYIFLYVAYLVFAIGQVYL